MSEEDKSLFVDVCRWTGKPIGNLESTLQSVEIILTTRLRSRIMNRSFGAGIIELLGRKMTLPLFGMLRQLIATALNLWEPRLRVRRVGTSGTLDELRLGQATIVIGADYRPGALADPPDLRVERRISFSLNKIDGGLRALQQAA